jgi:hypothetical protein
MSIIDKVYKVLIIDSDIFDGLEKPIISKLIIEKFKLRVHTHLINRK